MTTTAEEPSTSRIEDRELGIALAANLLARAREGRFEVARLTDEELTVLDGTDSRQVAPRPWLATIDASQHELVQAVALRGLAARGVVLPSLLDETTGRMAMAVDDDVHAVLVARRAASAVIVAERKTAHASWTKIAYLQGAAGVIEEDVSPGGLHTLWAGPADGVVESLARFADPDGDARDHPAGEPREIALRDVATGAATIGPLGESRLVTVIAVVGLDADGDADTRRLSVYVGDDGVETARSVADGRKVVRIEQVTADGLRAAIADVVAAGASR